MSMDLTSSNQKYKPLATVEAKTAIQASEKGEMMSSKTEDKVLCPDEGIKGQDMIKMEVMSQDKVVDRFPSPTKCSQEGPVVDVSSQEDEKAETFNYMPLKKEKSCS